MANLVEAGFVVAPEHIELPTHPPISDINEGTLKEMMMRLDKLEKLKTESEQKIYRLELANEEMKIGMANFLAENTDLKEKLLLADKQHAEQDQKIEAMMRVIEEHNDIVKQKEEVINALIEENERLREQVKRLSKGKSTKKNLWKLAFIVLAGTFLGLAIGGAVGLAVVGTGIAISVAGGGPVAGGIVGGVVGLRVNRATYPGSCSPKH